MRERKLVKVAISFEFLFEWITQGNIVMGAIKTEKGIPKDALFVGSLFDDRRMEAYLVFEHESFLPVFPGYDIPIINIRFSKYFDPRAEYLLEERIKESAENVIP